MITAVAVLATVAVVATAVAWMDPDAWHDELWPLLTLKTIGLRHDDLRVWIADNMALAILAYFGAYAALAVLLLPGSALMVVTGGLLFGPWLGIPLAWLASLTAATAAFVCARGVLPALLPPGSALLDTLRRGFAERTMAYMLALRFSPGLPFALVNVAPAALGVPLWKFLAGSAIGFLPSRIALATAGSGLGGVLDERNRLYLACRAASGEGADCPYELTAGSLLTPGTVAALLALACLAVLPAVFDAVASGRRRARSAPDVEERPS